LGTTADGPASTPGSPLRVATTWPRPGVLLVQLAGELDMSTAPLVRDRLDRQLAGRLAHLVIDLAAVDLIAAAGLSLLISVRHDTHAMGGRLDVVAPPAGVARRVLRLTGVDGVLRVRDSLAEALAVADEPGPT
jgi:anti-sigma B factor antagonist